MKIIVTAKDISEGIPESERLCPIALAIHRIPGWENAKVFERRIVKESLFIRHSWALPIEARHFIGKFDLDLPVEPFEFELKA